MDNFRNFIQYSKTFKYSEYQMPFALLKFLQYKTKIIFMYKKEKNISFI